MSQFDGDQPPPFEIAEPATWRSPIIFNSPHSGSIYPEQFLSASRIDLAGLRRSEDSFMDELIGGLTDAGFPVVRVNFPRSYVDVNREPYELDPRMFTGRLPSFANTRSMRVAGGLGTIPRVVGDGEEIYRERLVDCHSMPSTGIAPEEPRRSDIVIGDRYETSCAPQIPNIIDDLLRSLGYSVTRNKPYAGGFITEHYGTPASGLHAVQLELNRAVYMDERRRERGPRFNQVATDFLTLANALAAIPLDDLGPFRAAAE